MTIYQENKVHMTIPQSKTLYLKHLEIAMKLKFQSIQSKF